MLLYGTFEYKQLFASVLKTHLKMYFNHSWNNKEDNVFTAGKDSILQFGNDLNKL